jgi:DNA-binding transcriptional ArsR family regulator
LPSLGSTRSWSASLPSASTAGTACVLRCTDRCTIVDTSGTFFALSDPTRREIFERLGGGPATISELAKPFGLTINGVKKHVGILERADLVITEKVGRARHCRLGSGSLAEATAWIDEHRRAWESRLDRFERYVERTSGGGA